MSISHKYIRVGLTLHLILHISELSEVLKSKYFINFCRLQCTTDDRRDKATKFSTIAHVSLSVVSLPPNFQSCNSRQFTILYLHIRLLTLYSFCCFAIRTVGIEYSQWTDVVGGRGRVEWNKRSWNKCCVLHTLSPLFRFYHFIHPD